MNNVLQWPNDALHPDKETLEANNGGADTLCLHVARKFLLSNHQAMSILNSMPLSKIQITGGTFSFVKKQFHQLPPLTTNQLLSTNHLFMTKELLTTRHPFATNPPLTFPFQPQNFYSLTPTHPSLYINMLVHPYLTSQ